MRADGAWRAVLVAVAAVASACGGGTSHAAGAGGGCANPFPARVILAANGSSVVEMTARGPQGTLPGTRNVAPHHIAVSHDRCHLAVTTENDDSTGPLLVAADGSARHLHAAGGETNGIAWSPDDRSVAVSYQLAENSSIRIVDAATGDAHELTHFHGPSLSYRVAWLDDQTVLDLRITHGGFVVDTVNAAGGVQPYLTPADLRVGGIDGNTFAVDAAHHRLLLLVFSGTFTHQRDRRLVWVDLDSRRITPATTAALRPLDAQLGATFGPNGRGIAFMTGRAGAGRYACVVLRGAKRTQLPGNDQCDEIAWG